MQKRVMGLMLLSVVASGSTAMAFSDIQDHWADMDIDKLSELDILAGYEDGTFKPNELITRAEASKVITLAKQLDMQSKKDLNLQDMDESHWSYDYVLTLASNGYIHGYPDGTFKPDNNITREEFATMIYNALKLESGESREFTDIENSYAKEAIQKLASIGVVSGYEDSSFRPTQNITRVEATSMVSRALNILRKSNQQQASEQENQPKYNINESSENNFVPSETAKDRVLDENEVLVAGSVEEMLSQFKAEALKAVTNFDPSFTVRFETPVNQAMVEASLLEVFETNYEGSRVANIFRLSQIGNNNGQNVIYQIKYNIQYNRDLAEEQQIDSQVKALVPQIVNEGVSNHDKVKAIYDYIILNTVYATNYKTNDKTAEGYSVYSPMAILKSGEAICNGYAGLFYKMAKEAGIDVQYEAGNVKTPYSVEKHAWNKVNIDGEWKYIDTTWGDNENPEVNYAYFLVDRAEFEKDHTLR